MKRCPRHMYGFTNLASVRERCSLFIRQQRFPGIGVTYERNNSLFGERVLRISKLQANGLLRISVSFSSYLQA